MPPHPLHTPPSSSAEAAVAQLLLLSLRLIAKLVQHWAGTTKNHIISSAHSGTSVPHNESNHLRESHCHCMATLIITVNSHLHAYVTLCVTV